jgi:protoporphyrinogen oxidase
MTRFLDPGRVLIVGGGPTGLGAAWRFDHHGFRDYVLLEAEPHPGGLAASEVDARGFVWDAGGHVHFSHYDLYEQALDEALGDAWYWHERDAWVWLKERWVPYPFQHHVHHLDLGDQARILEGLDRARFDPGETPRTFAAWIDRTFGEGLAALFLRPYNEKIWRHPLERMSVGWLGERVAPPDPDDLRARIAARQDRRQWGPNHRFRYPARGGTGAIWTGLAGRLDPARLRFGVPAGYIDVEARTTTTTTNECLPWDTLISTIPLDRFVARAAGVAPAARDAARHLVANSVCAIGVGLRGGRPDTLSRKTWIYYPETSSPYYRVTVLSNYSPHNVPEGQGYWSLLTETSLPHGSTPDVDGLIDWTLRALSQDALVSDDAEVVSVWHRHLPYGYPVPSLGRDEALAALQAELEACRVFSRGRFGAWKYEVSNQDHCFMQGVELVDRLLLGAPEPTLNDPDAVNRGDYRRSPSGPASA